MHTGGQQRRLRIVIGVLLLGVLAHGVRGLGGASDNHFFNDWVYTAVMWGAVGLCLARAVPVARSAAPGSP